jgi:hypothetical protein
VPGQFPLDQKQRLNRRHGLAHRLRVDHERLEHVLPHVAPAAHLGGLALPVEVVVDLVGIGHDVARVAAEQRIHRRPVVLERELEQRVPSRRHQHPEVAVLAAPGVLHQHARRIRAEIRLPERVLVHRVNEGSSQNRQLRVPVAQRGARQLNPLAPVDALLARQR